MEVKTAIPPRMSCCLSMLVSPLLISFTVSNTPKVRHQNEATNSACVTHIPLQVMIQLVKYNFLAFKPARKSFYTTTKTHQSLNLVILDLLTSHKQKFLIQFDLFPRGC
jgi:hypothetical protein